MHDQNFKWFNTLYRILSTEYSINASGNNSFEIQIDFYAELKKQTHPLTLQLLSTHLK